MVDSFAQKAQYMQSEGKIQYIMGEYTLVTLPRIVTPYRDRVGETRARVTYQKLVTR